MEKSILLQAFNGTNATIPVWFMRQAGRFLPEYRQLRETNSLEEMFYNPEIAAEVTCLPVNLLGVDAAILFADILTLPAAMGFDIRFSSTNGPVIGNTIERPEDILRMRDMENLPHIRETIRLVNARLPEDIPLIGFAGGPFTALTYLLEGKSSANFEKTLRFAYQHQNLFHRTMAVLTKNTIVYLNLQKEAGIKVFQLFDTWAGILPAEKYREWVLPYVKNIFQYVDLPSIYYLKNAAHLLDLMEQAGSQFLSVCANVDLTHPALAKTEKGIQGNLYNGLLYSDDETLQRELLHVLKTSRRFKKYIFNLSHGIFPDVEVEKVKLIIEKVHSFPKV